MNILGANMAAATQSLSPYSPSRSTIVATPSRERKTAALRLMAYKTLEEAASISGVPAFGLPKINNFVGGIFMPVFSASPLWSTRANNVTPFD